MKKDCPHQSKGAKPDSKKVARVKSPKEAEKTETGEKIGKDPAEADEKAAGSSSSPVSGTSRSVEVLDKSPGRDTTATAELLSEATSLLKTLRSMKVLRVKELKPKDLWMEEQRMDFVKLALVPLGSSASGTRLRVSHLIQGQGSQHPAIA